MPDSTLDAAHTEPLRVRGSYGESQCTATITIRETLLRSMAGQHGGANLPAQHRCMRVPGHTGAHRASVNRHSAHPSWFRWDDWGFRLGIAVGPTASRIRSRHSRAKHASEQRTPDSTTEALWALVAAIDRLTAAIGSTSLDTQA